MAEQARLTALAAQIVQMHQEMEYWRRHEHGVAAQLEAAMNNLRSFTRRGRLPDPIVSAAVNNHSVALNQIRANMEALQRRKATAEAEHMALTQMMRSRGR